MLKHHFPYKNICLDSNTKILIDACFLLALQDENHIEYENCINISEYLLKSKCKLFVSNVVISEVINKLINKFFMMDVGYKFSKNLLNSQDNIDKIITYFYTHEQAVIFSNNKEKFDKFKFANHFDYILKKTEDYHILKVYFEEAISTMDDLENDLNISILPVNSNMIVLAKELSYKNNLGINDAQHLAVSLSHRMDYILTLDGDFEKVNTNRLKILTIENKEILEDTGTEN